MYLGEEIEWNEMPALLCMSLIKDALISSTFFWIPVAAVQITGNQLW